MTFRAAAVVIGFALTTCACSSSSSSTSAHEAIGTSGGSGGRGRGDAGGGVPVVTTRVVKKAEPVTIPAVGTVEPIATVQVRPLISGQLTTVNFKEGDEVEKGQLLFTIDPRPFEAALAQAEAVLERDTATSTNQAAEQQRFQSLFERGLIPRDQYEAQVATVKAAQAGLAVDRAAVESARLNLQYARITAPIAGRVGALGVHLGDVVHTSDTMPMIVINQLAPIYGTFSVPGRYLDDVRQYQARKPLMVEGHVKPAPLPGAQPQQPTQSSPDVQPEATGKVERATVTFIDNAIDAATGTIKLRATFDNRDRTLWPGLFLQITLQLMTEPDALVVPAPAVQVSQNGQYVYVVKPDQTAEMRPVTVERQQGNDMVIAKGIKEGEEVVTDGQLRLTPGVRVSVQDGRDTLGE